MLKNTVFQTSTTLLQKWRQSVALSSKRPRPKLPWWLSWRGRLRSKIGSTRIFEQGSPHVVLRNVRIQSPYLQPQPPQSHPCFI